MNAPMRWTVLAALLIAPLLAHAHEVRPAQLTVDEIADGRYVIRWKSPALGDRRIAIAPVFSAPCAAAGSVSDTFRGGASIRTWSLDCADGLADTTIAFSNLSSTMLDVLVTIAFLDGRVHTGLVRPSDPEFHIPARDESSKVFADYFRLGVEHIVFGWDHLLFVAGMLLLVSKLRRLAWAITGFTIAHSMTLALAVLEIVQVPGPPVEAIIALSIVLLAVESVRYARSRRETITIRAPWAVSLAIGLVHGLGFAGALSEYGLPPYAKAVSLAAFNLGVEAGQLAFVAAATALGIALARILPSVAAPARTGAAYFVGTCGSFWLVQRLVGFFELGGGA